MEFIQERDDVIDLNVGGKRMTTMQSTLCQIEGSLLQQLFRGSREANLQLPRDKDGCVFLDCNPKHFAIILDYLRAKKISTPENPAPLPKVVANEVKDFKYLAKYLGLSNEMFPLINESFFNHDSTDIIEVELEKDGTVTLRTLDFSGERSQIRGLHYWSLAQTSSYTAAFAVGQHIYDSGVFRFKLKLEHMNNRTNSVSECYGVGVVKENVKPSVIEQYPSASRKQIVFYGWGLNEQGVEEYNFSGKNIKYFENYGYINRNNVYRFRRGDVIEMVLDCDAALLSLCAPEGQQFQLELPQWTKFRLYASLNVPDSKLRIMEIRKEC